MIPSWMISKDKLPDWMFTAYVLWAVSTLILVFIMLVLALAKSAGWLT